MPWTNQSGGGGGPWGGGQSPWGRGPQGPKVEDIIKRSQDKLRGVLPGGFGSAPGLLIILVVAILLWGFSGVYTVQPDELGVVLRFGALDRIAPPGLNYHLPTPIESVERPKVTRVNRVEIGFRVGESGRTTQDVTRESLMLTGDENIVDINFTVFWVINDARKYLFNIRDPDGTVKAAAESAMREVIGHTEIASALAEGRAKIEIDTQKLLQEILDFYQAGITIQQVQLQKVDPPPQVIDAFRDVQSAKIDFTRYQNEADAYQNDVVPQAQGEAARIVQEAEAYKAQVVNQAQGDAQRFISVYNAYAKAPDVTARRLYIDTIQTILKSANKVILDRAASSSGVLPYLPLPAIRNASPSPPGRSGPGGTPPASASTGSPRP
ncbi:MAG TPA: FtsH protease activity modulator HflK [Stellaceae bacterium]|nr:FtsH protease activity modulator HflK [Stellaceae bacterium]